MPTGKQELFLFSNKFSDVSQHVRKFFQKSKMMHVYKPHQMGLHYIHVE